MQEELDPLNREQEEINRRRQMLYFRTETGIDPGQDMDERCILLHPVSLVPKHLIDACIRFCFLSTSSSTCVARDVSLGTNSVSCLHFFCSNRARNRNQDPESQKPAAWTTSQSPPWRGRQLGVPGRGGFTGAWTMTGVTCPRPGVKNGIHRL